MNEESKETSEDGGGDVDELEQMMSQLRLGA
jgi:hypothetical protein